MLPLKKLLNFMILVYHCLIKILHVKNIFLLFISLFFISTANAGWFSPTDFSNKDEVRQWCATHEGMVGYTDTESCIKNLYRPKADEVKPQYILDKYAHQLQLQAMIVMGKLNEYTKAFFLTMAGIGVIWSMYSLLFKEPNFNAFLYEIIRLILTIGFFWFIITKIPLQLVKFGNDFMVFAGKVVPTSSTAGDVTSASSSILVNAYNVAGKVFETISWSDTFTAMIIVKLCCSILIMILGFFIALNFTLCQLQYWLTACIGIFLLGFAITPWTRDTALKYLQSLLAQAFKLFTMIVCIVITNTVITEYISDLSSSVSGDGQVYVYNLINLTFSIYIGYIVCDKIPDVLANIISPISSAKANMMGAMISGVALAGGVGGVAGRLGGSALGRLSSGVMGSLRSK